jgi:tRNA threonylcarbamoyladenosine biosynthesis protein TsaB
VRDGTVLSEVAARTSGSHVAALPALVEHVLAEARLRIEAVDAVAVSIGPGSFTGLRIGLALAKGITFAGGIPLVTVPTLEVLAHAVALPADTVVCAALDARKREVYAAFFRVLPDGGRERLSPDAALAPEVLAERLTRGTVLVGDAAGYASAALGGRARVLPFTEVHPRGGGVARLGWLRLLAGGASETETAEPSYVRPPEAELARANSR